MVIRRVEPASLAKVAGLTYAALGLLLGALISLIATISSAFLPAQRTQNPFTPMFGAIFGVGSIIFLPIFYGAIGFITAWIGAWLYNLIASRFGGIEIEIS